MKTVYQITGICLIIMFIACNKEVNNNYLQNSSINDATASSGPIKQPKPIAASTTKSQFIANADGSGYADFTFSFASRQPGIGILDLSFIANETENVALYIQAVDNNGNGSNPGFFQTYNDNTAVALLYPGTAWLPDDGSYIPITFRVHYNIPDASTIHSGDTVSVTLFSLDYISNVKPDIYPQSLNCPPSPEMMITGAKPGLGLNIYDPDVLHIGLTRILELEYDSYGGSLGINNLPLIVKCTNTKIKPSLVVKDELGNIINTTTVRKGNKYTIQFPEGYGLNGVNAHTFFIYAHVKEIDGQASIETQLQPAANFSWTDIAGGRTTPFTTENKLYYKNFPKGLITVTKN